MHDKQDYKDAVYSQAACNASGVVFSLERMLPKLEAMTEEQRRSSPVLRLFAEQLNFLAGNGYEGTETTDDVLTVIKRMAQNMRAVCDLKLGTDERNKHPVQRDHAAAFFWLMKDVDWVAASDVCEKESGHVLT
jgi:hypothetical protein